MQNFDWTLIRSFLAVVDHGSFSAAGRALNLSQPTIGRQMLALETQLGATLFQRQSRGHRLTDAGTELLEHARTMNEAAARLSLTAAGQSGALSGVVRITASVAVSHFLLPPILEHIHRLEPDIELELCGS